MIKLAYRQLTDQVVKNQDKFKESLSFSIIV